MAQFAVTTKGSYRALPKLEIDGQAASKELIEDIVQLVVEESLHMPGMFALVLRNDYQPGRNQDQPWRHQSVLQIGKTVKIGFTSSTSDAKEFEQEKQGQVLEGEITAIETHFSEKSQAPIIVRGYDTCHRLHRGYHNRSFLNMTDSDIVKKLAGEAGLSMGTIEDSGQAQEYLFQQNQTNMQFLRERADRIGFELFNQDGKLHFRKPKANQELQLKWLKELHSFRVRVTSAEQVKEVEVRSWDYVQKRAIVATAQSEQIITETQNGKGSDTSSKFNGKPSRPKRIIVHQALSCDKEADALAKAVFNELSGQFIYADGKAEGNPEIRVGRSLKIEEMGPHSGKYYVTETRHLFHERVYTTEFSVRGTRSGDLITTVAPPTPLKPGQTMLIGIVTDNKDPKGLGRVKVKFPALTEEHSSNWARVVSPGAGKQRGFDCLPEINDEVVVMFEHGDIHRPYVMGGLWNGEDTPCGATDDNVADGKVRLRTFKTRAGHQLQFVDEDKGCSKAGVRVETKCGHQIKLDDSGKNIEIATSNGHKLCLNDCEGTVTLSSTKDMKLDAGTSMQVSSMALTLDAKGAVEIKAIGAINLTGSAITLNGGAVTIVTSSKTVAF